MTRAYAIGVAAGTQALILIGPELLTGPPDETTRAVLIGAAWLTNLAVAEYIIRRRARHSSREHRTQDETAVRGAGVSS